MNATTDNPHTCDTDALNALLRGEMSAVETYTQAMSKFDDETAIADLQKIRDEHSRAVRLLRDHVVGFGAHPVESPGAWDAFSAAVTGGAKAVGPAAALAALRQGEEHGINEYQSALENEHLHSDCQRMIRADLLPACRKHVEELNRLLGGMNH
jgi:hypothetical protein